MRLRDAVASGDVKLNAAGVSDWEAAYRDAHDDDMTTWIVPVAWDATRNETNAVRRHQIRLIETHRHPAELVGCSHPSGASLLDPISPSQGPIVPARRASACLRHPATPQDQQWTGAKAAAVKAGQAGAPKAGGETVIHRRSGREVIIRMSMRRDEISPRSTYKSVQVQRLERDRLSTPRMVGHRRPLSGSFSRACHRRRRSS